jgi:hypothetical protein
MDNKLIAQRELFMRRPRRLDDGKCRDCTLLARTSAEIVEIYPNGHAAA